jgi:hypothetical protein
MILAELCWSEPTNLLPMHLFSSRNVCIRFGPETLDMFLRRARLSTLIRVHDHVNEGWDLSLNNTVLTILSTNRGNETSSVIVVHGIEWHSITWPVYPPIKLSDVIFLTSIESERFTVQDTISSEHDMVSVSIRTLPRRLDDGWTNKSHYFIVHLPRVR